MLTATSTDESGNTSANSSARTITVDLTDPVATITSPLTGAHVNTASPNITFTATDTNLASVQCSLDGAPATACTSPWPTSGLSESVHSVVVLATDAAGREATATTLFTVDLTDPAPPVINSPGADLVTVNQTPSLSGISEANATITIYDNGVQVDQVLANGAGDWSWTSPTTVSEAAHPYVVTATDQAGNVSDDSNTRTITVDLTAPAAPLITSPATDISTTSVRPPIGGTAEPNALISAYDGATLLGTTPADGAGAWSFTPGADLDEGPHVFTATATDAADNTGPASGPRTVTIDLTAPAAPAITTPAQDLTTAVNTQPIGGTADLDTTVTVYDGAALIGTATTDGSGNWTLSPDPTFTEGVHTITAWATDEAGNTSSASSPRVITIDNTAPAVPTISSPTDGAVLADPTPDVVGSADPGSTVDVYDGAVLYCTTTANGLGVWSCAGTTALSEGDHTFTATATDPSGNESAPTSDVVVTIDLTNPSVSISSPTDGSTVTTSTPAISFSATDSNLDTIECRIGLDAFAACTSSWTTASLSDGVHVVSV
ncbi:MAG: Ig-like domain-containing protein, partial [Actinomycetota bacterium]|nr:Ig-like domain-containing protein [Actinomycetota bacterium]